MEVLANMKKSIKRIIALGVGATMVGATLLGALAFDLGDYPTPMFGTHGNGDFNAYVTIGSSGTAEGIASDQLGAMAVTGALGSEIVTCTTTGTNTTTVDDGYLVSTSGNPLNFDDDLYDVRNKLTKSQLPTMLKTETFDDKKGVNKGQTDYTQEIDFTDSTGTLEFAQNTEETDKPAGTYLYFAKTSSEKMYTYKLDFTTPITYDTTSPAATSAATDLELNKIKILGEDYKISDISYTSGTGITKITLMKGLDEYTQGEYTTETYTVNGVDYEVEVVIIADTDNTVKFDINGETTDALAAGDTYTLSDGTVVGVSEVMPNEGSEAAGADQVTFWLGASKIALENGKEVYVNDVKVEGSNVAISTTDGTLSGMNVTYRPKDKLFLSEGDSWTDPAFGAFKYVFTGVNFDSVEQYKIESDGDDSVQLTCTNYDGDELVLNPYYYSSGWGYGEDASNKLVIVENTTLHGSTDITDLEGTKFLFDENNIAHIVEIDNIDTTNDQIDFTVDDTSTDYEDQDYTDGSATTFTFLDSNFQLTLDESADNITFTEITDQTNDMSHIVTKNGGEFYFNTTSDPGITFKEVDGAATVSLVTTAWTNISWTNSEVEIGTPSGTGLSVDKNVDKDDTYNVEDITSYGTKWHAYTKDQGWITIDYPDSEAEGEVYVAPVAATTTTSGSETCTAATIDFTTASKLDTEAVGLVGTHNLISIGGPCVNRVTASLLGLTFPACGNRSTIPEDAAMLKVVSKDDTWALIAAGWGAANTQMATTVLANHADYASDLDGKSEVQINGVSASALTFGSVAAPVAADNSTTE